MIVTRQQGGSLGVEVRGFDPRTAPESDVATLLRLVYTEKIVVLKDQELSPQEYVRFSQRLGRPEVYYEPMYHHPEAPEILVSSNLGDGTGRVGVPKTGQFWHADYQFMPNPFGLTLVHPQVVPERDRGTYFIDMTAAYQRLSADLKEAIAGAVAWHSPRRYFKIRPSDVYRPVKDLLDEIEQRTPAVAHPAVFPHPVTGAPILYISEALTYALEDSDGAPLDRSVLEALLEASAQLDEKLSCEEIHLQFLRQGDLLIWDNRALVHRARHTGGNEPAVSHRITVHDAHPFYAGIGSGARTASPAGRRAAA